METIDTSASTKHKQDLQHLYDLVIELISEEYDIVNGKLVDL